MNKSVSWCKKITMWLTFQYNIYWCNTRWKERTDLIEPIRKLIVAGRYDKSDGESIFKDITKPMILIQRACLKIFLIKYKGEIPKLIQFWLLRSYDVLTLSWHYFVNALNKRRRLQVNKESLKLNCTKTSKNHISLKANPSNLQL